jgi:hypothetical protein
MQRVFGEMLEQADMLVWSPWMATAKAALMDGATSVACRRGSSRTSRRPAA